MKILRVTSDLYPFVIGGIGIHTHEMSKMQAERGNDVTVITFISMNSPEPKTNDYRIITIPVSFRLWGNSFSFSLPFRIWNETENNDIVHAHSHLFFSTVICAILRHFSSTPLIITNHGLFSQTAPMWVQKIYMRTVGKWTLQSADTVICYTKEEKEQLMGYGIQEKKIEVIHNGISSTDFLPSLHGPDNQILWIGRFTPGKGVGILIDAFQTVHSSFPNYTLVMIGDGPLQRTIQEKITVMNLGSSINGIPYIPNRDLPGIYQHSTVFVLPSLEEGVPRTILEAMSCGVPVVCTDLPQLKAIVEGCGIIVPVRDPEALAGAMCRLISDREFAKQCGINGRERIVGHYSWDDTVEQTLAHYEEVIQSIRNKGLPSEASHTPLIPVIPRGGRGK